MIALNQAKMKDHLRTYLPSYYYRPLVMLILFVLSDRWKLNQ